MAIPRLLLAAIALSALAPAAHADRHTWDEVAARYVEAWNAHDELAMQELWVADATQGGAAAAKLFAAEGSRLRSTSVPIQQTLRGRTAIVDVDVEIAGTGAAPEARRVRMVMVWGKDLPGGHHPGGRYFLSSVTFGPARRSPAAVLFTRLGKELSWLASRVR